MLNETQLALVQGGWFIDIVGGIFSVGAKIGNFCASLGFGNFNVHDSMGQSGTMHQYSASLSPASFGSVGLGGRETSIKVLNSDNMRDMSGVKIAIGASASLPKAMQDRLDLGANTTFGIAIPNAGGHTGASVEVTVPVVSTTGRNQIDGLTFSMARDNPAWAQVGGAGFNNLGVQLQGTLQFNDVRVNHVDEYQSSAYNSAFHPQFHNSDGTLHQPWQQWY